MKTGTNNNDTNRAQSEQMIPIDITRSIFIACVILFAAGLVLLSFYIMNGWVGEEVLKKFFIEHFKLVVGVPCSVLTAFAIVLLFYTGLEGKVEFDLFSLKLSGPGGAVMLFILCFLSVIFGIYILP